jgi:CHASE2 domain-containing sensor protein
MEYLEGRTIRQALQEHTWLPFPDAADHLRPVAAAIDFAHAHNIVHGDLKPANLFLAKQADGSEIVKVVDFGLAQLRSGEAEDRTASMESSARSTGSGSVRGTPAYMAPELFRGEDASPQSDQFAFGVLTYEMLTGLQPFGKRVFDVTERHSGSVPRPSTLEPALPAELDSPILNLLDRAPEMRPPSASAAVSTMEDAWLRAEQRKWRERELPQRYVFALVAASIAIAIAAWLASWRVVRILESRTVDSRFALAAKRLPDPRLLVVMLDDSAMAEEPRSLAQWDGKFADLVERILGGGARAVALDFLLPASWSTSRSFARLVEQHSDRIQLAIFSELGKVVGTECIGTLTARLIGPERYSALFGFANLEEDQDGRIRRARAAYSDPEGTIIGQSLAARAIIAASLSPAGFNPVNRAVWIDYSVSPRDIPSVSWSDAGARSPDFFNDKLVMIGADFAGSTDRHRVPEPADPDWVPGVLVHAMIANTIVRGFPVRDAGLPACLAFMSLACFGTVALAIRFPHRPWLAIIAAAASFSGYALFAFGIFRLSRTMLVMVAPETALLLSMVIAWRLRARLAPYPMKGA